MSDQHRGSRTAKLKVAELTCKADPKCFMGMLYCFISDRTNEAIILVFKIVIGFPGLVVTSLITANVIWSVRQISVKIKFDETCVRKSLSTIFICISSCNLTRILCQRLSHEKFVYNFQISLYFDKKIVCLKIFREKFVYISQNLTRKTYRSNRGLF